MQLQELLAFKPKNSIKEKLTIKIIHKLITEASSTLCKTWKMRKIQKYCLAD